MESFFLNKRLLSSRLVLSTSKISSQYMILFHFRCPPVGHPFMTPNESCQESCLVKIEISNKRFPNKNAGWCLARSVPTKCGYNHNNIQPNVGIYIYQSHGSFPRKYKPTNYFHFFPRKFSSPFSPKASRRGVAKSGEVTGGAGGVHQPTGEVPRVGWVGSWGNVFLAKKNRSRIFWGIFFFKCVCLGVVVNVSC